jgi:protein-tyrosine phosphatase
MYPIRPWLYVGKFRETLDYNLLHTSQINAMMQLAESVQQPNISSLFIAIEDGKPLPFDQLKTGIEFVQLEKTRGGKVLIACGAGISRAASFAIATLKEQENLSLLDAFWQVRTKHPEAMPHPALWQSLCEYYSENVPHPDW